MRVRSHPATWFELLVPREELPRALAVLASTHTVPTKRTRKRPMLTAKIRRKST